MAIQSQPSRIPEPFAGSGTKNTIPATNATPSASQAASWASGFPPECSQPISAGGCPVPRNDMNGALNQLSQDYAFRQDGGVWAWSALADYGTNRVVLGSDGKLYWSVAQSGPNVGGAQDPTADNGTYWTAMPTNDGNVVHRTGNESIAGYKLFTNGVTIREDSGSVYFHQRTTNFTKGDSPVDVYSDVLFTDANDVGISGVLLNLSSNGNSNIILRLWDPSSSDDTLQTSIQFLAASNYTYFTFAPYSADNDKINLGQGGARWKEVFAVAGAINTSDERLKTSIDILPDEVLDAWGDVGFVQYQFRDAAEKKGVDAARLHSGLIAQRIDEAFKARGLDASRYALFCYDTWDAQPELRNEKGEITQPAREAGDEYSLRYEEALCMEAAYQRRRADRAEARIAALEERLAAIEAKLNS